MQAKLAGAVGTINISVRRTIAAIVGRVGQSGIDNAYELPETDMTKRAFVPETVNVRKIRRRLGLSQQSFAQTYGFALSAVRDWEQGRRRPERSARILLKIVEREPEAVTRALAR